MGRARQPEHTRAALLEAAGKVFQAKGAGLSLDAVAREAGVSKGGLLHHYPTKERLLAALAHDLLEQFGAALDALHAREVALNGEQPGSWLRAYIELSFTPDDEVDRLSAALGALAALPEMLVPLQEAQAFLITRAEQDGIPAGRAHAIRLACDGFWLGLYVGMPELDESQRRALKEELMAWTRF